MTLVGLEPTISGSVDRCLIHWATGPTKSLNNLRSNQKQKRKPNKRSGPGVALAAWITQMLHWFAQVRCPSAEHAERFCLLCRQPKPILISLSARTLELTPKYPCRARPRKRTNYLRSHCEDWANCTNAPLTSSHSSYKLSLHISAVYRSKQ